MQQAMRGGMQGQSPLPGHIQHPPPNPGIQQPQPGRYEPNAAQLYDQQQRMLQQQHQHREHQLAMQRGLGVQQQVQHQQHQSIQHSQIPGRQMVQAASAANRQIRPIQAQAQVQQAQQAGWPHPTLPGVRISEQDMRSYQLQAQQQAQHQHQHQHQQQGWASTPQAQHQRAVEHQLQLQQQQQQQLQQHQHQQQHPQHQQMQHAQVQGGYRMVQGQPQLQSIQAHAMPQHASAVQQMQQQLQQSIHSTPTQPPPSHAPSYLETNPNPSAPANAHAGPSSAGPFDPQRSQSRQAMRSASPMPPPTLPTQMQMSASTSALQSSAPAPTNLPPRSSTLPLPVPTPRLAAAPDPTAGPSSAPSHTPHHTVPTSQALPEDGPANPLRVALRETLSTRLKRQLERTEKQLAVAEKVERTLKKRKLGGKCGKDLARDEKWRGKFDDLVLEYLEKGGYERAVEGLKADREKEPEVTAGVAMEKAVSADSAMSTGREDTVSGNTTLIEGDESKAVEAHKEDKDVPSEEGSPKTGESGMEVDVDVAEKYGEDKGKYKEDKDGVSKGGVPGGRDLGKLFNWYTIQRSTRHITSTLQLAAIREFRHATDIPVQTARLAQPVPYPAYPGASAPNTAQVPSSATAAKIVISAPQAAVRAASANPDRSLQAGSAAPAGQSPASLQLQQQNSQGSDRSPGEMVGLTATLQQADAMRASQEAQIQAQQAASRAMSEQARVMQDVNAQAAGESHVQVRHGDRIIVMTQSEYQRRYAAEQNWVMQQQQLQGMGIQQAQQQQPQQGLMVHPQQLLLQQQQIQQQANAQQQPQPVQVQVQGQAQVSQPVSGGGSEGYAGLQSSKRGSDTEGPESSKKAKISRKTPTPEEHQRQAIEMANRATAMPPFTVPPGVLQSIQAPRSDSQPPGLQRQQSDLERQLAARQDWTRQISAQAQNAYQQQFHTGMTPASGPYDDAATPQTSDMLRPASQAGMVPSPTVSRASHKKRPSAIGLGGSAGEGEQVTPTSGRKKGGGKKAGKASAKGKKGKQGTPSSADGPSTPFGIPQTPATNITHTPSHPPGEFQPIQEDPSPDEREMDEPLRMNPAQELQVQLQHHRHPLHSQQSHSQPPLSQHPQYAQHPPRTSQHSNTNDQFLVQPNGHGQNGNPFDGIGLDDEILKALNGFGGDGGGGGGGHGESQQPAPQSATNFDSMGFDLEGEGLNFDWGNVDFGNGDTWAA